MQRRRVLATDSVDVERLELEMAGDDMAACLERFLAATADEPTMQRARRAVTNWHGTRARRATAAAASAAVVKPAS